MDVWGVSRIYGALSVSQGESLETPQYSFHFLTTSIQQMGNVYLPKSQTIKLIMLFAEESQQQLQFLGSSTKTIQNFTFNNRKWFLYQIGSVMAQRLMLEESSSPACFQLIFSYHSVKT